MAAKPSTVPRWAETALGVQSNVIVPPKAKMDTGWLKGEQPPVEHVDWLFNQLGRWVQYLSDGALSGDHSIAGALAVLNDVTVGDLLEVGGAIEVNGLISALAGLTAAADQHVTVQGTGQYKHGDITLPIVPFDGYFSACAWDLGNGWVASTGAWNCLVAVELPIGKRIKSATIERLGTAASSISLAVRKVSPGATGPVSSDSTTVSNPAASWVDTTLTLATPETIAAGEYVYVHVSGGVTGQKFKNLRVVFDEP